MIIVLLLFTTFLFPEDTDNFSIYSQLQEILKSGKSCEIILVDGNTISAYQIIDISENEITVNILHDKRLGYNRDIVSMADYHNNDKTPKLLRTIEIAHIQSIEKFPSFYENPTNVITVLVSIPLILMFIKYFN
jgi:hypothetical protein